MILSQVIIQTFVTEFEKNPARLQTFRNTNYTFKYFFLRWLSGSPTQLIVFTNTVEKAIYYAKPYISSKQSK